MLRLGATQEEGGRGPGVPSTSSRPPRPKQEKIQQLKKINQQFWAQRGAAARSPQRGQNGRAPTGDLGDFPELAALEQQFQARLAEARGLGHEEPSPRKVQTLRVSDTDIPALQHEQQQAGETGGGGKDGSSRPEPRAVVWAERNKW